MSINQELSFDSKSTNRFNHNQLESRYNDLIEQWQDKISYLQQNIQEMQQQKEDVKNALIEAQSRMKNKRGQVDDSLNETKSMDTIIPINLAKLNNSMSQILDDSITTQESQSSIQSVKFQPIASFLLEIGLKERYFQNFIDLKIYDNVSLQNSLPSTNYMALIDWDIKEEYQLNQMNVYISNQLIEMGLITKKGLLENLKLYQNSIPSIKDWLKSINYQQYYPNFCLAGYDSFEYLVYQEQSQYKLTLSDFKESFCIDNESDSKLILAHITIMCDKIKNLNLWNVQTSSKKAKESNFGLVQCALPLPNNKCVIF
ncbi:unnamed protein product (macronuclear) [Paramecium tetraurelia]|uniref:SAM domain-containing protein n=1 Tax=Paramecium tetraurelia TaxID=5888 RepID=A0DVQ2_PARTE|nr:uncharacterized protein GSPATT00020772001 [Paramecium tetraurelia]CAK87119.1 unnamed protein product [Paramecium tetraurelia]|eukprot:XP_001454516.1 hypothetical protein (macronuclear) [Paramecium tetraurelia strain d4-2]